MNIVHFLLHFFVVLSISTFYLKFCCIFPERFSSMQIKWKLLSLEIVSALEKKELLSHFRAYRKSATSEQTDGPLETGIQTSKCAYKCIKKEVRV